MKKKSPPAKSIQNRRARHDYATQDEFIVGIALNGRETKALRLGHGQLQGAYVTVKEGELWLLNAAITSAKGFEITEEEQTRSRKLLAKRKEIERLVAAKQQGLAIIPLEIMTRGHYIKLKIATARG
ncbi:MAG TPA: SsrA-binding protein, partial [Patescibacteria group bacterium]|nr:SsrA-binding protein [Patescibacteria group bacterium]